ncbi:Indigoidine synthase A like protein-domain-containing protein [Yarrowia lipolytica]|uniref:Indigoidine synthase A like protein-domain-containing protein n=1 Tax=Yarrowia lipolytica TaxID=4952 RepID=A0A371C083_YARLL|nr:Indigoidine synthase A like protein-domain-containing protein [Yarrowia lipolytica]
MLSIRRIASQKPIFQTLVFRQFATAPPRSPLVISEEIQQAINDKKPVIALESTIITHGLPYPQNLQMHSDTEQIIRKEGGIPALTAFVNGVPRVGVPEEEVKVLAENTDGNHIKVSRRDIGYVMANGLMGGTTVAATMILAHMAGIKVFATGGIGGVHRGAESTFDISADLDELSKTPVAVVCAGPKSILDIPLTVEYLETKGVHVSTYGADGTNIPGFFTTDSGVSSPYNFFDTLEAAKIIQANSSMNLQSGTVWCVPPPDPIPSNLIHDVIDQALVEANELGIKGKATTPFLLDAIRREYPEVLKTNIGLVQQNAVIATRIASDLATLESGRPTSGGSGFMPASPSVPKKAARPQTVTPLAVVGGVAMDVTCGISGSQLGTSHPGKVTNSIGGVGHNIVLAIHYTGSKHGISPRLISAVGQDGDGNEILSHMEKVGLDTSGIKQDSKEGTARYVAMHDKSGDLVVACADMDIIQNLDVVHIGQQLTTAQPKWIMMDGNIGLEAKKEVLKYARDKSAQVAFEPTSVPKAAALSELNLPVYPNNSIALATPNTAELEAMFEAFHEKGRFDVDDWFPVIDGLALGADFRNGATMLSHQHRGLKAILEQGTLAQAIHMLPYIPTLIIKGGANGVVVFQLIDDIESAIHSQRSASNKTPGLFQKGNAASGNTKVGVYMQYFEPEEVGSQSIVSVTGAGDTLFGTLAMEIVKDESWLNDMGDKKSAVVSRAMNNAVKTIQSKDAVCKSIL